MSRAKHLAIIAAAFDRVDASPHARDLANVVGSMIIEHGETGERFLDGGWTPKQIRAVVLGYAAGSPPAELSSMAYYAQKQIHWVEWWDLAGDDGCQLVPGVEVLLLPEREARRAEAARVRS